MIAYVKGGCYEELKKVGAEGPMFDMVDSKMAMLIYFVNRPSSEFIDKFNGIRRFQIGMKYYHKLIMLTFSTDETKCVDMVYAPQLTSVMSIDELRNMDDEGVLGINVVLVDSSCGRVEGIHFISSTKEFYAALVANIKDKLDSSYSVTEDQNNLRSLYSLYPTSAKLEKDVDIKFKIQD